MGSVWGDGDSGWSGVLWSPSELPSTEGACRNGSTANSPGAVSGIAMSAMQPMATRQPSVMRSQGFLSDDRSEEHTSELQSLMRISYAVFCLKKKKNQQQLNINILKTRNIEQTITSKHHTNTQTNTIYPITTPYMNVTN